MTIALTNTVQSLVLNWLKGTAAGTPPSSLKLGLLTVAPNPDGSGVTEPTSGYARQTITFGSVTTSDAASVIANTNSLVFGPASADWPQVSYGGLFDQSGNLLAYGPLSAARVAPSGDTISFGIGALQFSIQ